MQVRRNQQRLVKQKRKQPHKLNQQLKMENQRINQWLRLKRSLIRLKKTVVLRLKPNYSRLLQSYQRLVTKMRHVTKHFISEEGAFTIWPIFRELFMICLSLSDGVLTKVQREKNSQNIINVPVPNYLNQVNTKKL